MWIFCFANAGKAEYGPAENQNWERYGSLISAERPQPHSTRIYAPSTISQKAIRLIITASAMSYWSIPGYSLYPLQKSALLQWARTIWSEKNWKLGHLSIPIATIQNFLILLATTFPKLTQSKLLLGWQNLSYWVQPKRKRKSFLRNFSSVCYSFQDSSGF